MNISITLRKTIISSAALFIPAGMGFSNEIDPVVPLGGSNTSSFMTLSNSATYQIGDVWGKLPVSETELESNDVYRRVVKATVRVGGGTGFYLGKFAGEHVVGTNNHVMSSRFSCRNASFPALKKSFKCKKFLGTWKNIDMTLFTITVNNAEDEKILEQVGENFAFHTSFPIETPLITSGFGIAENRGRQMMVNQDGDCKTFSAEGEYKLMADPDDLNTGPNRVWSFALGCEVSHGDSGSAIVNRLTGEVIGIIWTGRIPKSERVQRTSYLNEILDENNQEEIWGQLSYAVPAEKIKDFLQSDLESNSFNEQTASIVREMLTR
jgi:hypothetical protein